MALGGMGAGLQSESTSYLYPLWQSSESSMSWEFTNPKGQFLEPHLVGITESPGICTFDSAVILTHPGVSEVSHEGLSRVLLVTGTPEVEGGDGTHQKPFSFAGELTSLKTSLVCCLTAHRFACVVNSWYLSM